jgi:PilZ domain
MPQDQALSGRMERRLPVIVVVRLAQLELPSSDGVEWTYTDNVSAHGARVFSKRLWQPGDEITVAPYNEETTHGNVVYCQRMADGRCFIGVKFKDQVAWSIVRRYDGIKISLPANSKSN